MVDADVAQSKVARRRESRLKPSPPRARSLRVKLTTSWASMRGHQARRVLSAALNIGAGP